LFKSFKYKTSGQLNNYPQNRRIFCDLTLLKKALGIFMPIVIILYQSNAVLSIDFKKNFEKTYKF